MIKHIELNQVQDPEYKDRTIADLYLETDNDRIAVGFLSEEGSDLVLLEDMTAKQLRALALTMAQTYK